MQGVLLGTIQSGKTRGLLVIIAVGFDEAIDIAIMLTKSTKALSGQTVERFRRGFAEFIEECATAFFPHQSDAARAFRAGAEPKADLAQARRVHWAALQRGSRSHDVDSSIWFEC